MLFIVFLASIILGVVGASFISRYAHLLGLIDRPNERSSHNRPTPKGGGIGILGAFFIASLLYDISILFWLPVTFLSLLSLFGDRINLAPRFRLIAQFLVAFLFLIGVEIPFYKDLFDSQNFLTTVPIYLFLAIYIVGTANFFNFMDGINGIAGITGIIGFGMMGVYGMLTDQSPEWVILSFVMASACAGFLPFNIPKAKVFMGDVGSILIGFVFACMVAVFSHTLNDFVILASFMFPFYADELMTMIERIIDRQSLTLPHRRHFYQVLANEGESTHWKVSLGYGMVQLFIGLIIWFLTQKSLFFGIFGISTFFILFFYFNMIVKKKLGCWIGNKNLQDV